MENDELIKRMEDLAERSEKSCTLTQSLYLTPAEQFEAERRLSQRYPNMRFFGGHPDCERKAALFLPYYMNAECFDPSDYFCAVSVKAHFGIPEHRDYMGAVLALGIKREWIGDIWVQGDTATVFCLPSVKRHILDSLDKVGRCGVKCSSLELSEIPAPEIKVKRVSFSIMSLRFDAVLSGMFGISRTSAAEFIRQGAASLNYSECLKPDAAVSEGDIISLRGHGKGRVGETGGQSRKGRTFISAEIYK